MVFRTGPFLPVSLHGCPRPHKPGTEGSGPSGRKKKPAVSANDLLGEVKAPFSDGIRVIGTFIKGLL